MVLEIPLEAHRVEADSVSGVGRLEYEEERDGIDRILEASTKKTGKVRTREHPSIAQTSVENSGVPAASADRVSAAGPDLDFADAFFGGGRQVCSLSERNSCR